IHVRPPLTTNEHPGTGPRRAGITCNVWWLTRRAMSTQPNVLKWIAPAVHLIHIGPDIRAAVDRNLRVVDGATRKRRLNRRVHIGKLACRRSRLADRDDPGRRTRPIGRPACTAWPTRHVGWGVGR